jgi:hypothetical protein
MRKAATSNGRGLHIEIVHLSSILHVRALRILFHVLEVRFAPGCTISVGLYWVSALVAAELGSLNPAPFCVLAQLQCLDDGGWFAVNEAVGDFGHEGLELTGSWAVLASWIVLNVFKMGWWIVASLVSPDLFGAIEAGEKWCGSSASISSSSPAQSILNVDLFSLMNAFRHCCLGHKKLGSSSPFISLQSQVCF